MSNSDIEQTGTVKGNLPNGASLSGRISNGLNLSGRISIGSGSSDFIINMTVTTTDGETFTVTSCDATREQINAAVAADKRVVLRVSAGDIRYELPMVYSYQGYVYLFTAFILGSLTYAVIEPVGENENEWSFVTTQIEAYAITYSNSSLSNVSDVEGALNELVSDSHTHLNKSVLDKLSVSNGKLQYNGSDAGLKGYTPVKGTDYWTAADKAEIVDELKPSQVTSGTSMTLADNTEYRLTDVTELTITYPDGNFECWMRLAFAAEGAITVTLPATTQYIGTTPTFANGETWELSIKDGVVIAQKVGDGT